MATFGALGTAVPGSQELGAQSSRADEQTQKMQPTPALMANSANIARPSQAHTELQPQFQHVSICARDKLRKAHKKPNMPDHVTTGGFHSLTSLRGLSLLLIHPCLPQPRAC